LKRREAWTGEPDSQAAPEEPPAGVEALRAELAAAKKAQAEAEKKYQSLLRWTQGGEREGKRIAAFTFAAAFVNSDAEKVAALLKTLDIPLYEAAAWVVPDNRPDIPPGHLKRGQFNRLKKSGAFR
jgi:hypothetical protein